jgi:sensor histidine kinase YesM
MRYSGETITQIRMITLAVVSLVVFLTVLQLFFSPVPVRFWTIFLPTAVITLACSAACTLLLFPLFETILRFRRPVFYVSFAFLVAAGILMGVCAGNLLLSGRLRVNVRVLLFSLLTGLVFSALISASLYFRNRLGQKLVRLKEIELENERLKRLESETRLRDLQAKLNPHFLFNALNSTAALIYDDRERAERSIERLSGLYRRVLSVSSRTLVPLREEMNLIEDYLELERLRFDDKLSYRIDCPEALKNTPVPGFLIEPLVENAVRHGFGPDQRGLRLSVKAEAEPEGRLRLTVEDNGPGFEVETMAAGFGLFSIQERLRLLFGDRASLDIRAEKGRGTEITILLPPAGAL